ncbi:MAG TPA: hypothetical protein VF928_09360 [Usitatibacteraceae bacterium]
MSRKVKAATTIEPLPVNDAAIKEDLAANDRRVGMLAEIDEVYGASLPYARERVIAEAAFFFNQGSESFFEAGKRLILLKEHEEHGGFLKALDSLGIEERTARRMMTVAAKFSNRTTLSDLSKSKLLELAVLDDEELDALDRGGTVAGLQVDAIEQMSVRELKAALRTEQQDHEATRTQVAKKDEKINALDKQLTKRGKSRPWAEEANDLLKGFVAGSQAQLESLAAYHDGLEMLAEVLDQNDAPAGQKDSAARTVLAEASKLFELASKITELVNERYAANIVQ